MTLGYSVALVLLAIDIDFVNILLIATNMVVYMLYPVGDPLYKHLCNQCVRVIFLYWYDDYVEKKSVQVEQIAEKYTKYLINNISNQSSTSVQKEKGTSDGSYEGIDRRIRQSFSESSKSSKEYRNALKAEIPHLSSFVSLLPSPT